jgi:predicted protein tyrosine phosphatase
MFPVPSPLRVLFVCGKNLRRSPTAETMYRRDPRLSVRSAGVSETSRRRVRESDLDWADVVFVMEAKHAARLRAAFPPPEDMPSIESLDIPDDYERDAEELIEVLRVAVEGRLEHWLG